VKTFANSHDIISGMSKAHNLQEMQESLQGHHIIFSFSEYLRMQRTVKSKVIT